MKQQLYEMLKVGISGLSAQDQQRLFRESTGTPAPIEPDRLIRPRAAALRLGCTSRTIFNLLKAGNLTRIKLPGRTRGAGIKESELNALIAGTK